jgi:hypothetical protein
LSAEIAAFVDRVMEDPAGAPKWWGRMWLQMVLAYRSARVALIDAPAPYTELRRIQRGE